MLNKSGRRKNFRVNRLVALAFVPNPYNLPEVGHIQEPKTNNRWDNLEWTTHKDNLQYASAVGAFERRSA
jgi:hypothetical protein